MANDSASAPSPDELVGAPFARLKAAWSASPPLSVEARLALLDKLQAWILANEAAVIEAISADFSHRSPQETRVAEIALVVGDLQHTRAHLREWARPEARSTFWGFLPASTRVIRQPLGIVGVMVPWNYPFQLAVVPLAGAIAAGNRVLIKPSELTPRTASLLVRLAREVFPADHVDVVQGDVDVASAFARLPFDHLFFTGSTSVGKLVMRAAAENLVPVTLELGGKSPTLVHPSFDVARAAGSIAGGKLLNAGQTCIAPDYVLVGKDKLSPFVAALEKSIAALYPRIVDNPDYTAIISERHHARLTAIIEDARRKGAEIRTVNPAGEDLSGTRKLAPTLVIGATPDMLVMQDEIFGPILPILPMNDVEEGIRFVNARPRPLALYYFDDDGRRVEDVLARTTSGGASVNATLLHMPQHDLPFGGVGASGMGRYHGFDSFRTFSHEKGVFYQVRWNGEAMIRPPYGKLFDLVMRALIR